MCFTITAEEDYQSLSQTLVFSASGRMCLEIVIVPDQTLESNETFNISIDVMGDPGVSVVGTGQAEVTILNDDG